MGKLCKRLSVFVFIAILSACFAAAALRDFNPKLYGKVWRGQWVDGGAFEGYQVLHFRRTFDLKEVPKQFKINVSADNRYRLFVNGKSVSAGPARGDLQHWFFDTVVEEDRWQQYLEGTGTTLVATALALLMGVILGVVVAVVRTAHDQQRPGRKKNPVLGAVNAIFRVYVTVIRGTPMMLQLLIWAFVVFKSRQYTLVGIFGLGINSGAYVSEIIRGGLMAVDGGQMEAGRSLGMNYFDTMRFIVIPQAIKAILPSLGNEFIILLKDTSLLSMISGQELLYFAQAVATRTYNQMFPLIGAACIYLVLVLIFTWLLGKLERRLRQSDRR